MKRISEKDIIVNGKVEEIHINVAKDILNIPTCTIDEDGNLIEWPVDDDIEPI